MDWFEPLNLHCERGDSRLFWGEPLNAWTNLGFLIAAAFVVPWIVRLGRRLGRVPWELWLLNALLVLIGIGSFTYHTVAVRWAEVFDVGAIFLWMVWCLVLALWRVLGWRPWAIAGAVLLFTAASPAGPLLLGYFVWAYLPTLFCGTAIGLYAVRHKRPGGAMMLASMAVFVCSITSSRLDHAVCEYWPMGTHFLWHQFNSVALALATIAMSHLLAGPGEGLGDGPLPTG